MIASVTFLASRHPMGRWYSCHTNQVSSKSIAIRFAGSCPITWRTISRLSADFRLKITFRAVITAGLCTTAYGMLCGCWATERLLSSPKVSASVCTNDCFRSAELRSRSTAPSRPPARSQPRYPQRSYRNLRTHGRFPVTFAKDWNHTARFHERHRAQLAGRHAEPGDQTDADSNH